MDIFFLGKKPPESIKWEEIRAKILKAIEDEKKAKAQVAITSSDIGTYPPIRQSEKQKIYTTTANENVSEFSDT